MTTEMYFSDFIREDSATDGCCHAMFTQGFFRQMMWALSLCISPESI